LNPPPGHPPSPLPAQTPGKIERLPTKKEAAPYAIQKGRRAVGGPDDLRVQEAVTGTIARHYQSCPYKVPDANKKGAPGHSAAN